MPSANILRFNHMWLTGFSRIAALLILSTQSAQAYEIDLSKSYVEASFGNIQYNTPNDFFFSGDSYDNPTNLQLLVGTHFNRKDNKVISIEGFYNVIGEGESSLIVESTSRKATIDASTLGVGIRFGVPMGESFILSTRFGIHFWQADGKTNLSSPTETIVGGGADENGIDAYGGLNLSYVISQQLFVSVGGQAFPMSIQGDNIHISNFYLGAGYYF